MKQIPEWLGYTIMQINFLGNSAAVVKAELTLLGFFLLHC